MKVSFREVPAKRSIKIDCGNCGKPLKRIIKEFQTINPFNKTLDGRIKTADDIYRELPGMLDRAEARMREKGVICRGCEA